MSRLLIVMVGTMVAVVAAASVAAAQTGARTFNVHTTAFPGGAVTGSLE